MAGLRLISETPARALAVYAHPDDPDISCGGSLARWAVDGCEVSVVICASGDKGSTDPEETSGELAARRADEARRAAGLLGAAGVHLLGYLDGELENDTELRGRLVSLVRSLRPEVVVCPDPTAVFFGAYHYNHRDHRIVGWATLDAVAPAASSPLYFPEAGGAHQVREVLLSGSLEADCCVDITGTIETKVAAVGCHKSQLPDANDWFALAVRDGAQDAGRQAGVPFAEVFRGLRFST